MLILLLIILAVVWLVSWSGPRYYPAYSTRYSGYPFWGGSSHVLLVLLGYAALLMTAVGSIIYLMQERRLKTKRPGALFDKLPPLGTLDKMITQSMGIGFAFITLAVVAGSTWAFIESGTRWIREPKIAISLLTWAFYLAMVFLRFTAGWRGRKAAVMAIAVLCCSALTWVAHVGLRPLLAP